MTPGLHADVSHDAYHADPAPTPSLSASIAKVLLTASPLHAWQAHPRLGGGAWEEPTDRSERGSVIHGMLLGAGQAYVRVEAEDWRTKAAREAREAARADGKIAVLAYRLDECTAVADRLRSRFDLKGGAAELTALWQSPAGALCRGRLDYFDGRDVVDLKTCENARASASGRNIFACGYDIQAAAYLEAVSVLKPELAGRARFRLVFAECHKPFGVLNVELAGEFLELGRRRWRRAVEVWAQCLASGTWPGYPTEVQRAEAPAWAMAAEMDEQMRTIPEGGSDVDW